MLGIAWLKMQTQKLMTMRRMKIDRAQGHPSLVSRWMTVKIMKSGERVGAPDQANTKKDFGTGAEMERKEAAAGAPRARMKDQDLVNNQANLLSN